MLVVMAVLPNVVHVYGGVLYIPGRKATWCSPLRATRGLHRQRPLPSSLWFYVDAPFSEPAKALGYRWEQYRRCWWVFAAVGR